jgi:hypothetical protein
MSSRESYPRSFMTLKVHLSLSRHITDTILTAFEMMHYMKNKRYDRTSYMTLNIYQKSYMTLKLDMSCDGVK